MRYKFQRRELKLFNKKRKIKKHGKSLSEIYRNAIEKEHRLLQDEGIKKLHKTIKLKGEKK